MTTLQIVVAHIRPNLSDRLPPARVLHQLQLRLYRPEARLYERIVVTVPRRTHALPDPRATQHLTIPTTRVLPAPVAVVDQSRRRLTITDRSLQSAQHQFLVHRIAI